MTNRWRYAVKLLSPSMGGSCLVICSLILGPLPSAGQRLPLPPGAQQPWTDTGLRGAGQEVAGGKGHRLEARRGSRRCLAGRTRLNW